MDKAALLITMLIVLGVVLFVLARLYVMH